MKTHQRTSVASRTTMDASTLRPNLKPPVSTGWIAAPAGVDAHRRLASRTDAGENKRREARCQRRAAQRWLSRVPGRIHVAALHVLIDGCMNKQATDRQAGNRHA